MKLKKEVKKTGPETLLTDEILENIRTSVLVGDNLHITAEKIGINDKTLQKWYYSNYITLYDKVEMWKLERRLNEAERVGDEILAIDTIKEDGTHNPSLLAIKQREAEFLREALVIARKKYNKKETINFNVVLPQPILGNIIDVPVKDDVKYIDVSVNDNIKSLDK